MSIDLEIQPRQAAIIGWGSAVPSGILSNLDLERLVETNDEWIVSRTGIKERRVVREGESTFTLALEAARGALATAHIRPNELDLIVVGTCTPEHPLPSTACMLQEALDAPQAPAFDLQAACSGFLYSLSVARQFILSGEYRTILVVGADAFTRFIDYTDRTTCILFGDGAGAVVLRAQERPEDGVRRGLGAFKLGALGAGGPFLRIPAGGNRYPATAETVVAREHFLKMEGQETFKLAVRTMSETSLEVLRREGLSIGEVDLFIPHQANLRIIEAVGRRLDLPAHKVLVNVDRYGNTSAASIPISICEAVASGRLQPGMRLLLTAFGSGLTWASGVVYWGG